MKCYYHESLNVMGQCPSCSKFLCKICLDEFGTNFCRDCTVKKYRKFCEEFKEKLQLSIQFQNEKIELIRGVTKEIILSCIIICLFKLPFHILFVLFIMLGLFYKIISWGITSPIFTFTIPIIGGFLAFVLPIYFLITNQIARCGARLHRELKEKERTEKKIKDFSPEIQALFIELRLVATSVSPFGRDQIYEEPGESNVLFARMKRNFAVLFSSFSAPVIYRKIKETRKKLIEDLERLEKLKVPSFEKFVAVQRTLLADEEYKPVIPDFQQSTDSKKV